MAPNLANSWSAHYARLVSAGKDDSSLPGKYSKVLPFSSTAMACREHLVSVPDCVAMFVSPSGRIQLLHHAHWDKVTPVYTAGTNTLWALLGAGDSLPVAMFDHNLLAQQRSGRGRLQGPSSRHFSSRHDPLLQCHRGHLPWGCLPPIPGK